MKTSIYDIIGTVLSAVVFGTIIWVSLIIFS